MSAGVTVVDLDSSESAAIRTAEPGVLIGVSATGRPRPGSVETIFDTAAFTLTEADAPDPRFVRVESVADTVALCRERIAARPITSEILVEIVASYAQHGNAHAGLVTESLAYSTLQAGPEFRHWLAQQKPRRQHLQADAVKLERVHGRLDIVFDRPDKHNAFSDSLRSGLLDGLGVATADSTITEVRLTGNGPSFCSGGDLNEFGLFADPASSHRARRSHSPAAHLESLRARLGSALRADVHGAVIGSGLEMAAFCGTVTAHPGSIFALPEQSLGLIPGAGGTVSVTRRIGHWRTAYMVLSGARIDAATALQWGLIDSVADG